MLLRGVNKQVILIRDTGSDLFDQAIFIVSDKGAMRGDIDMARAAQEIIGKYGPPPLRKKGRGRRVAGWICAALLAAGILAAVLLLRG